ncbi:glutamate synthase [Striga asiatica]|uniref:Glutamate synthase n=1 Tax=Striga asiatica TaxID=4170 RepID=A0A5A7RH13_STRAF|nr:glutamate synthase [Striga asiatica]
MLSKSQSTFIKNNSFAPLSKIPSSPNPNKPKPGVDDEVRAPLSKIPSSPSFICDDEVHRGFQAWMNGGNLVRKGQFRYEDWQTLWSSAGNPLTATEAFARTQFVRRAAVYFHKSAAVHSPFVRRASAILVLPLVRHASAISDRPLVRRASATDTHTTQTPSDSTIGSLGFRPPPPNRSRRPTHPNGPSKQTPPPHNLTATVEVKRSRGPPPPKTLIPPTLGKEERKEDRSAHLKLDHPRSDNRLRHCCREVGTIKQIRPSPPETVENPLGLMDPNRCICL